MLDPEKIPADPDRPGATIIKRETAVRINSLLGELVAGLIAAIPAPPAVGDFYAERLRAYGQTVRRAITELSHSVTALLSQRQFLAAVIVSRSLLEHFASFRHFLDELQPILEAGDCVKAHLTIRTTAMRHSTRELRPDAKAKKVATLIASLSNRSPQARENYEFLCQFVHPSAFSVWLFYGGDMRRDDKQWHFQPGGWDEEQTYKWAISTLDQLHYLQADLSELDALVELMREKCRDFIPEEDAEGGSEIKGEEPS